MNKNLLKLELCLALFLLTISHVWEPVEVYAIYGNEALVNPEVQSIGSRLRGLSITPDDMILGLEDTKIKQIKFTWLGESRIKVIHISAGEFATWFNFPKTPIELQINIIQVQGDESAFNPAHAQTILSEAFIDFTIMIPNTECTEVIDITRCAEKKIYEIPINFDLEFEGNKYTNIVNFRVNLTGLDLDMETIQNLITYILIGIIILGTIIIIKKTVFSGNRKRIQLGKSTRRGFGSSDYEKKIKDTLSNI